MPRITNVECPGRPPICALTFDVVGLIKGVEARRKEGCSPKVVQRWGEPDASKCLLAAASVDRKYNPIEVLNPLSGDTHATICNSGDTNAWPDVDLTVGLHSFKSERFKSSPSSSKTWNACGSGSIEFSKVDGSENYALLGGKGVEVNVWEIENCVKTWTAKPNKLGIFTPTWSTSATFLSKDNHRKMVAGTGSHQVRLYDICAQGRPVVSFGFGETPVKAVAEASDGYAVYVGDGCGNLASFDM